MRRDPKALTDECKSRKRSEETRARISAALKGNQHRAGKTFGPLSEETKKKISDAQRGKHSRNTKTLGRYTNPQGYVVLSMHRGHPLAGPTGEVLEHRFVLYNMIGPGMHQCHWCERELHWGGRESGSIRADHLNGDCHDNRPENLVASCHRCNIKRGKAGNPIDWSLK